MRISYSQAIVSAVATVAFATFKEFAENLFEALEWPFYSGLYSQQSLVISAVESCVAQGAIEGGEGTPSGSMFVTGLSPRVLKSHIMKTNKHLSPRNLSTACLTPRHSSSPNLSRRSFAKSRAKSRYRSESMPSSSGFWLLTSHTMAATRLPWTSSSRRVWDLRSST